MGDNIDRDKQGSYGALLFDPRWRAKREEILKLDNYKCVICGSTDELQVHHRQYHFVERLGVKKMPWDYDNIYLITLCKKCHERGHNRYDIPMKYIK